jgi:signal transduction histidine kinase/FixJ family two-component response regulator
MSHPAAKGEPTPGSDTEVLDPALATDKAKSLLKSLRSFLADSDLQSARIRVAVTIPVAVLCLLGWVVLTVFGNVFPGGTGHPETMLIAGGVLLLIGAHAWIYREPSIMVTTVLAAVIALVYVFSVSTNGLLPTIFMSAVLIALHAVAVPRAALLLSLLTLALTPPLVWFASAGEINYPYLFRSMASGIIAVTFMQLLYRSNTRFKNEAHRVAQGLETLTASLGASLEQAVFERRRAEDALVAVQAADARLMTVKTQLEDAVGSMSQGLVMVDAQGRVVLCNPQTRRILDLPQDTLDPQALLGNTLESPAEHGDQNNGAPPSGFEAQRDQPAGSISRNLNTPDGRHVEMNSRRMHSGYTVHTYTDVSGYVHSNEKLRAAMLGMTSVQTQLNAEMQRARQESDMKLRFVASVSHEIRTPLNGITGMVDVIARSGLTEQQSELIADLETSTKQLRELTDDILDLSHLKDAKFSLALQPFDLTSFVDKVVRAAQGAAQAKGLMLELFMRDVPCMVIGDTQRLQQVLNNLIHNAIKFTAQGWVRLYVECRSVKSTAGNLEVIIAVSDSGRGIARGALTSIFEPFSQGDTTINRDFGGTGLGLTLSRELCEAMGGSIRVTSRLGKGSVFTVAVVLQRSDNSELFEDTVPAPLDETTPALAGRRILVVDDNRINHKLLALWLKAAGAHVHQAFDGAEGLRAASAELFDAILMDVSMPVMNGMTATRAIRLLGQSGDERLERLAAVPVIGVTAMARPEDLRLCLEAGMDAHLGKPLERAKLLRTIKDVMEAHHWLSNTGAHTTAR